MNLRVFYLTRRGISDGYLCFPLSIYTKKELREYYYKRKKAAENSAAFLRL